MSYQPQDERVERATSRWWRTPVVAACLRLMALLGFAGLAWFAGMSTAHADAGTSPDQGQAPVLSTATAGSPTAPATSILGPTMAPATRPLASAVSPVTPLATAAVSPISGHTSGALAPATTPASGASVVTGAAELIATPAHALASQAGSVGNRGGRTSPGLLGSAALVEPLSMTQCIATSLGVDDAVAPLTLAVRPLADTARPLTDRIMSVVSGLPKVKAPAVRLPIDDLSSWTGVPPVPATEERSISPVQAALPAAPAVHNAGPVELSPVQFAAFAVHRPDYTSGPAVGAGSSAPTSPVPVPGSIPVLPGAALHSGSAAGSSSNQHDGSAGAVGTSSLATRLLASRALGVTEDSGVTLVRAEDPSVSPD